MKPAARRAAVAGAAAAMAMLAGAGFATLAPGCARPMDIPRLADPPVEAREPAVHPGAEVAADEQPPAELDRPERGDTPGIDVRTIDDTVRPEGPITPAGGAPPVPPRPDDPGDGTPDAPDSLDPDRTAPPRPGDLTGRGVIHASDAPPERRDTDRPAPGYRTVGGVLAEVNGRPIFTDDVLLAVENELRGLARQFNRDQFLRRAFHVILDERNLRIQDEEMRLVFERNLSAQEQRQAAMATAVWRVNFVTEAGGSEARARRIAIEREGASLERLGEEQYSRLMGQIFYARKVLPRAAPSAQEMRAYYERHRDRFREPGGIEFRVIELNVEPGQELADVRRRAELLRQRVLEGEEFEEIARAHNDNPLLKSTGGDLGLGTLQRGAFRWRELDDAAWQTAEGELTPVVQVDSGRRVMFARVISKRQPRTYSFGEVQQQIFEVIQNQRRDELLNQYLVEARQYAAITPQRDQEKMLMTAMEIVAQRYEEWRNEE